MGGFSENDLRYALDDMAGGIMASGVHSDVGGERLNPELKMSEWTIYGK